MTFSVKNELFYGARALIRDNFLCGQMLVRQLQAHELMTEDELQQFRLNLLYQSLQVAIKTLPYYANIRNDFSSSSSALALQELFPIIDKITLLNNRSYLYPNNGKPKVWQSLGKTSGTTGTPLMIIRSPQSVLYENAFIKRHWAWSGYQEGMKRATLRGDMIIPLNQAKPPYWFKNRYNNQLLISSRHLKDHCIKAIVDELNAFEPFMLQAYPSTAFTLAKYLSNYNLHLKIPLFLLHRSLYTLTRES